MECVGIAKYQLFLQDHPGEGKVISLNRFSFQIDMQNIWNFEKTLVQLIIAMTQTEASCRHRYITSQGTISLICK